jgi:hypothetical protein
MAEKTLLQREKAFKELVDQQPFPPDILQEFYEYWTEPNKSESKMRFELEKTWHLNRRIKRWQRIRDSRPDFTKREVARTAKPLSKPPENDMERLEVFYTAYCIRPVAVNFNLFGQWFEFMKAGTMLKELSQEEKEILKQVYGNNAEKLRCAWVQKTLDYFMIINYQFKKTNLLKAV